LGGQLRGALVWDNRKRQRIGNGGCGGGREQEAKETKMKECAGSARNGGVYGTDAAAEDERAGRSDEWDPREKGQIWCGKVYSTRQEDEESARGE
jgi:hypothetical protein